MTGPEWRASRRPIHLLDFGSARLSVRRRRLIAVASCRTISPDVLGEDGERWLATADRLRHVDDWWCEGNRACVVVRGVEHVVGDEESPARNEETVITYGLRRFRGSWVIATWSQGWPRFGSADKLPGARTWRDGWGLAE